MAYLYRIMKTRGVGIQKIIMTSEDRQQPKKLDTSGHKVHSMTY